MDPLREWLELCRATLAATEDPAAALERAAVRRAELCHALEARALREPLDRALADELTEAEQALQNFAAQVLGLMAEKLGEVQRVRSGTRGYRPARTGLPAFFSRSV